jgi:hypothetical protein
VNSSVLTKWSRLALALVLAAGFVGAASAQVTTNAPGAQVIYYTGFEVAEGYAPADQNVDLRGQLGWVGDGSGGNGIVANFFEGYGQQAYIGYNPPAPKDVFLNLWQPFAVAVPAPGGAVVRFAVLMQVVDSTNGQYDDFRWSGYNTDGQRLFTLDFDNATAEIAYALDDTNGFYSTGFAFSNDALYELEIYMNFARNDWTARLNGAVVVDSQPITTTAARRDLSDMDAVWALHVRGQPGDNYMLFDDYEIDAEPGATIPPVLETAGLDGNGQFNLILHGERSLKYAVDVTDDFRAGWFSLATNLLADGVWHFTDSTATNYAQSFYRAREVNP